MISTVRQQLLVLLTAGCILAFAADGLKWLSPVPVQQRDALAKRLDAYVKANRSRDWSALFDLISEAGRGGVSRETFVEKMNAAHGRDLASTADLLAFRPDRTMEGGDSEYDVYGCGEARREARDYNGVALVHAVYQRNEWFFSGWMFTELPNESCKPLSDPSWEPPDEMDWRNHVIEELGGPRLQLMNDPVFGIDYDPHQVRFENVPPSLEQKCAAELRGDGYWLFAYWREADTEYLLISSQRSSETGAAAVIRGTRCTLGYTDSLLTGERFGNDAADSSIVFSSSVLHGIAKDLLDRYSKAFGGKDRFIDAVRKLNNFSPDKYLPPVLRTEYKAFSEQ